MKIGLMLGATPGNNSVQSIIDSATRAERDGFDNIWMAHVFGHDAITALALAGRETSTLGLGTAVVPSFPRHPTALAQQVLTASSACSGRFTLGLGLSHKWVIEDMMGLDYSRPASHMRDYLEVLLPLLSGQPVSCDNRSYKVELGLAVDDKAQTSVVLAALGPRMLRIAGELTDGTTTWMTGLKTLEQHIIPSVTAAAADAGKPTPTVVAGLPIVVTDNKDNAYAKINETLAIYGSLPSYQAMLQREGVSSPADVALIGNEQQVEQYIVRLRDIGVTDFNAVIMDVEPGAAERTHAVLQSQLAS